jgi:hypothetical protein
MLGGESWRMRSGTSFVDARVEAARLVLGCCGAVAAIAQHYAAGGAVSRREGTEGVEGGVKTGIVAVGVVSDVDVGVSQPLMLRGIAIGGDRVQGRGKGG